MFHSLRAAEPDGGKGRHLSDPFAAPKLIDVHATLRVFVRKASGSACNGGDRAARTGLAPYGWSERSRTVQTREKGG